MSDDSNFDGAGRPRRRSKNPDYPRLVGIGVFGRSSLRRQRQQRNRGRRRQHHGRDRAPPSTAVAAPPPRAGEEWTGWGPSPGGGRRRFGGTG